MKKLIVGIYSNDDHLLGCLYLSLILWVWLDVQMGHEIGIVFMALCHIFLLMTFVKIVNGFCKQY